MWEVSFTASLFMIFLYFIISTDSNLLVESPVLSGLAVKEANMRFNDITDRTNTVLTISTHFTDPPTFL